MVYSVSSYGLIRGALGMAKGKQPGKGVRSLKLDDRVKEAAEDLFEVCDGVVIVCVKFSGANDGDEQVVRSTRGARIAVHKAIDMLNEYDESSINIAVYDEEDDADGAA